MVEEAVNCQMLNTYPKDTACVKLKLAGHVAHTNSSSVVAQLFWLTFTFLLIYMLSDDIYLHFFNWTPECTPAHLGDKLEVF